MNNPSDKDNNKPVVEFSARITLPDGQVIGKTVPTTGDFPSPEDFDLSTKEGFLADFDALERAVLEARDRIGEEISSEFLKDSSKKTPRDTKANFAGVRGRTHICPCAGRPCIFPAA